MNVQEVDGKKQYIAERNEFGSIRVRITSTGVAKDSVFIEICGNESRYVLTTVKCIPDLIRCLYAIWKDNK